MDGSMMLLEHFFLESMLVQFVDPNISSHTFNVTVHSRQFIMHNKVKSNSN